MTIRLQAIFFVGLGFLLLWFLYLERAILTPFILAGIFAYVFNPLINFLSHKIRLPRTLSILLMYGLVITLVVAFGAAIAGRMLDESSQLSYYVRSLTETTRVQISLLPDLVRPTVEEALISLEKSKLFSPQYYLFSLFPAAISRIVSFIIFLFSGFYFLKEGRYMVDKLLSFVPKDYKIEVEILLNKINAVLNGYLRGQIFLVFLVSLILFIALSILGVRFTLIVAVFSGFAEIVPFIGPIVATTVAAIVVLVSGTANFPLTNLQGALVVIIVYTVVRQFQDYFITPHVMGKITKLHPLVILFSVLAGEHLWGILGLILAVPIAATLRILLLYSMDRINEQQTKIS